MRKRHDLTPAETRFERIGSWTLALTVVVVPLVYWPVSRDPNLAKPIALVLSLMALVVALAVSRARGEPARFRWTSLDLLVILYLLITGASWTYSAFKHASVAALRPILIYTMFYFAARTALAGDAARRRVLLGLLAGCAAVSVLAIAQQFGQLAWGLPWMVGATWFNRTFLAAYLLLILPIAAWCAFTKPAALRLAAIAALVAGGPALVFTGARIAWVALMQAAWRVGLDRPLCGHGAGTFGIHAPEKIAHEFYTGVLGDPSVGAQVVITNASDLLGAEYALREFRRACAATPNSPAAQYDLANALAVLGRHEEALRVYRIVEVLAPNYGRVHFNQGTSLYNLHRYSDARREMALAYRLDGLPDSRIRLDYLRKLPRAPNP